MTQRTIASFQAGIGLILTWACRTMLSTSSATWPVLARLASTRTCRHPKCPTFLGGRRAAKRTGTRICEALQRCIQNYPFIRVFWVRLSLTNVLKCVRPQNSWNSITNLIFCLSLDFVLFPRILFLSFFLGNVWNCRCGSDDLLASTKSEGLPKLYLHLRQFSRLVQPAYL